jgi:hypothetical protein
MEDLAELALCDGTIGVEKQSLESGFSKIDRRELKHMFQNDTLTG